MNIDDYFWKATVEELKQGYFYNQETRSYTCLICSKTYQNGIIYPIGDFFYTPEEAVKTHLRDLHKSMFEYFLNMNKTYTGLTELQKELMMMFHEGYTDKEIVDKTGASNTSTIRNHRFSLKEKYKQAKIIVAMSELLDEQREFNKKNTKNTGLPKDELVDIHRRATMVDNRYAITQEERDDVLNRYFNQDNHLVIKEFPSKEKKKIIILQQIMKEFEPNRDYSEKEVNEVIKDYYDDIPFIRRYLIQYGFLDRTNDGKRYWVKL